MIYTQKELKDIIAPIAEKHRLPSVHIFGSYARGEATADSDIDLIIDDVGSLIGEEYTLLDLCDDL